MMSDRHTHKAFLAVFIYLLAGSAWIFLTQDASGTRSDATVPPPLLWPSIGFLLVTGTVLFFVIHWQQRRFARREAQLEHHEESVQSREARSRAILENAADGIIAADGSGTINLFNPAAARIFGYQPDDILGRNIKELIPRPYLPEHESYHPKGTDRKPGPLVSLGREVEGRRQSGESFPLDMAVSEVIQASGRIYIAVVRDITDRKKAEAELTNSRERLRSLAARLQSVREEERTRISREIHDELGQALTGVKMDLSWIKGRLPQDQPPVEKRLQSMSRLVDGTIQTVRKIATDLRPGILDNLGLIPALEWQAKEFQSRTGISCLCRTEMEQVTVDPEVGTALFRIFQETLTNVARHAQADDVDVRLFLDGTDLCLSVHDNGRGITLREQAGSKSLGLLGMRERAGMLGGKIQIEGRSGQGTLVLVRFPHHQTTAESKPAAITSPHSGDDEASRERPAPLTKAS